MASIPTNMARYGAFLTTRIPRGLKLPRLAQIYLRYSPLTHAAGPAEAQLVSEKGNKKEGEDLRRQIYADWWKIPKEDAKSRNALADSGRCFLEFYRLFDPQPWLDWQSVNKGFLHDIDYLSSQMSWDEDDHRKAMDMASAHQSLHIEGYSLKLGDTKRIHGVLERLVETENVAKNADAKALEISEELRLPADDVKMYVHNYLAQRYIHNLPDHHQLTLGDVKHMHSILLGEDDVAPQSAFKLVTPSGWEMKDKAGEWRRGIVVAARSPMTVYAYPREVPVLMSKLFEHYNNGSPLHPIVKICQFYINFLHIHPFCDGNGRIGRLLMSHLFRQHGYINPPLQQFNRAKYIDALFLASSNVDYINNRYVLRKLPNHWLDPMTTSLHNIYMEQMM